MLSLCPSSYDCAEQRLGLFNIFVGFTGHPQQICHDRRLRRVGQSHNAAAADRVRHGVTRRLEQSIETELKLTGGLVTIAVAAGED